MKRYRVSARAALAFFGLMAMLSGCGGGASSSGGGNTPMASISAFSASASEILIGSSTTLTATFSAARA